ncbi:endoplasmic reticulum-based factor for assembly of V-ATPase-domain-containing protein [Exophiala viscosa]|uniref:Endoplasmic reticulum-based factor for assembly of V-ATPase-domain-containing protein n=1 Tax=Exophiala viscosa TaxID=2486360 RepID=A0AAN6DMF7_9EURO|nr:endoplasmic reticulum-based factor for assembly of V-ATPase-domain-containing protein [Exophiala viscosa]
MVLLTTTPRILAAISTLSHTERSSLNALPSDPGAPIEHSTLISLSKVARETSLNNLLRGAHIYRPPPPPKPEPSPGYVALMARLRREEEQREYANLVSKRGLEIGLDEEKDDISPQLVFNILLSIVMCAGAIFYLTRWWHSDGLRVLLSLSTGVVVGVAEVTVYAGYLRKVKLSKEKEVTKREKKQFIGEYKGEVMDTTSAATTIEKQEIWGRGVNGGIRRRVRDKWEKGNETN